ncbi:hypothetical protein K0504_09305 [Neiella marina]|uniref:Cell division inhibitor SulA n=1 Tax=Neiella holothuriorum TaxID=2870530 RepID=A0ABS7EFW1_9GAMM|nr:SulA-like leucine-rich domain-containing protein [Neiella holothuriorum]MBW8191232.1 hypothetical protein [Neiella holothuriorum]
MKHVVQTKLKHPGVWQVAPLAQPKVCLKTGNDLLNQQLNAGGWQSEVIYEMSPSHQNQLLKTLEPVLSELSQGTQWLILLNPPKSALDALADMAGVNQARLLIVHGKEDFDSLWAAEQALAKNNAAGILTWAKELTARDIKRLKLAARGTNALSFVFPQTSGFATLADWPAITAHQYDKNATKIDLPVKENNQLEGLQHCLH